jgi:uncharacterized membrane protein YsdA (DUF1294 family)
MSEETIKDMMTDAIRYWEVRRIVYNAILTAIVAAVFVARWPESRFAVSIDVAQSFFILAVLANVAYCAAYIVDLAAQYSAFRSTWRRYRSLLFATGIVFAGILARFCAMGIFSHPT